MGVVYCLNALTGASEWKYTTKGAVGNPPVAYNGYVYVGTGGVYVDSYYVYCLNAQTGAQVWNFTIVGGDHDCGCR
jgi:outer membrane protein assembly factor BamB